MDLQSREIVTHTVHEATMLKFLFSKSTSNDEVSESLELANIALQNRVVSVLQSTARNQEKFSTLTSLRALHS